jgi:hypothetical protein
LKRPAAASFSDSVVAALDNGFVEGYATHAQNPFTLLVLSHMFVVLNEVVPHSGANGLRHGFAACLDRRCFQSSHDVEISFISDLCSQRSVCHPSKSGNLLDCCQIGNLLPGIEAEMIVEGVQLD